MQISVIVFLLCISLMILLVGLIIGLSARLLTSIALDRTMPRIIKRKGAISGIRDNEEFSSELIEKGKGLEERSTETVEIVGYGGVRLTGHILIPDKPKRVIIALHGWRGSWSRDFGIVSDFWYSSSSAVIYAEQRGQRGSGGDFITFGLLERLDVIEWVRWTAKRFCDLPIYLCGVSMGASSVLMSADLGLPGSVHGIIADSGFTSPDEIWKYVLTKNLRLPYSLYKRAANRLCRKKTGFAANACSTLNSLENSNVPVLFIHGTDDSFVPVEMTYRNYEACRGPKRLFLVPGANHCMSYYVDKSGYETEMAKFWEDYD